MMVLIVEDDALSRKALARLLRADGHYVDTVGSAEEALEVIRGGFVPQVVLIDVDLPGMDGLDLTAQLAQEVPQASAILTSAVEHERIMSRGDLPHPQYLRKPLPVRQLLHLVASAPQPSGDDCSPGLRSN